MSGGRACMYLCERARWCLRARLHLSTSSPLASDTVTQTLAKNPFLWRIFWIYGKFPLSRWFQEVQTRLTCFGKFSRYLNHARSSPVHFRAIPFDCPALPRPSHSRVVLLHTHLYSRVLVCARMCSYVLVCARMCPFAIVWTNRNKLA